MNSPQATVGSVLRDAFQQLQPTSETPLLDSQVSLGFILNQPRSWIVAHPERPLTPEELNQFQSAVKQMAAGTPLAHLLGKWEFFGLEFLVSPEVLIPRPETELLVEHALAWLKARPERRWAVDAGTGSGCIAISLANQVPDLKVIACDLSPAALHVARQNIARHQLEERVLLVQADLLPPACRQFDLVCANLPYIPSQTLTTLPVSRHEPQLALDGGPSGAEVIQRLLKVAPTSMLPGACILLEIEAGQGDRVPAAACQIFPDAQITARQDLAGHDRLVIIQLPENSAR